MKKHSRFVRLTSLLLTLLMVGSCFVALPFTASAVEDLNEEIVHVELDGPSWTLPSTALPSKSGSANAVTYEDFSVQKSGTALVEIADPTDSQKTVWGFVNNRSSLVLNDVSAGLTDYAEFAFSADLYFDAFPSGTRDGKTADDLTLSLFKWRAIKSGASSATDIAGLRINTKGELHHYEANGTGSGMGIGVTLPEKQWFNLTIIYRPAEGRYIVVLDGMTVYQNTFTAVAGATGSQLYLLDGYYQYTAYVRDITVTTSNRTYWTANTNTQSVPTAVNSALPNNVADDFGDYSMSSSTIYFDEYADPTNSKQKVWGFNVNKTSGTFFFHDDENVLAEAASFTVSTDMYFDEFPTGTYSATDGRTADDYPVSLLKWRVKRTATSTFAHNSIRVNAQGELCTDANATSGTGVFLPKDEWFHIEMTFSPELGRYEIYINGEPVYIGAFTPVTSTYASDIGFFDGYFKYTAYVRNPAVFTRDEATVGVTREDSADYYGYQSKAIDASTNTFDVRFLSSIDPMAFSESGAETSETFAEAGYEVTAVWYDDSGEVQSSVQSVVTDTVFRSVNTDSGDFTMPDGDYIHAFILRGVDATRERIEFTIRPYTELRGGGRRYGSSASLLWVGETDEDGYPVLSRIEQISPYKTGASEDTFVRLTTNSEHDDYGVNGERTALNLKYVSATSTYNRQAYLKFNFNEVGAKRITEACRILLRMYAVTAPAESAWTTEEVAAGGVMGRVNGCSSDWSEDTLSAENNYPDSMPTVSGASWDIVFRDDEWVVVDVTDYVKTCTEDGAVSFMMQLTSATSRSDTVSFRSSEYTNAPEMIVYPTLLNYQTDIEKYSNTGYEPWAYAEELVADWVNEGYKNAYTAGDAQLHLDYNEMTSVSDASDNKAYTITPGSDKFALVDDPAGANEKVLGLVDYRANYQVVDTNAILLKEDTFTVEADFLFTEFPNGTRTDTNKTPAESPMNLLRWMPKSGSINTGVRINDHGELFTNSSGTSGTGHFVTLGEWFNIRIDFNLTAMSYSIYLDGELIAEKTFSGTMDRSVFYMLDGYFTYSAYMKDFRVSTYDGYATYDLTAVNNASATGAYITAINWRANQAKNKINSKVYVRSIESLASVEGYDADAAVAPVYDEYGGIANAGIKGEVTGYFHTEIVGGRTFIIDPLGNPYFAVGMNTVQLGATDNQKAASVAQFGSEEAFYSSVTADFKEIGINTVWGGDWQAFLDAGNFGTVVGVSMLSSYMSSLRLSNSNSSIKFKHNNTMNVFDPDFVAFCTNKAITVIGDYADDPRILGWTTDNEISAQTTMLYDYLTVDATAPENAFSYAAAWTFLKVRTGKANPSVEDITAELSEEFKAFVYDRYYQVCTDALDGAGAKQMYLGNRIHSSNRDSEGYLRAASQYVDILTVNLYGGPEPPIDTIEYMYKYSGKPIIVTEFYAKAQDALDMNGIPLMNQTNAGWVVETQEDRAAHYENYVMLLLESRCCVGWTWYRFRDNDQRVYGDTAGNAYVDHDITAGAISSYIKVGTYTATLNADGKTYTYDITVDPELMAVFNSMDLSVAGDPYLDFVSTTITAENAGDMLKVLHKGEYGGDNSNNGSNKGLYDNNMNIYQPLADAYAKVDKHIMGLVNYFDALHAE